jgi:hypothetical protein
MYVPTPSSLRNQFDIIPHNIDINSIMAQQIAFMRIGMTDVQTAVPNPPVTAEHATEVAAEPTTKHFW